MTAHTVTLVAFVAGGQHFVLDVMRVRELVRAMPLVPAPGAPPWLQGHMVLRGEVLPVLSLQLALTQALGVTGGPAPATHEPSSGHKTSGARRPPQILVLDVSGHSLGLEVTRVNEVLRLPAQALRPDLGPASLRSPISLGICDVHGLAHILLDMRPLMALTNAVQATAHPTPD